ncbi:MAG: indolepyruvate ferredoxin oxidoreductase subunit alpha [Candidatus Asgardarchaeia archaeon]
MQEQEKIFLMMGNEAIARGAIEAGIKAAVGYPGTPSTEVIETISKYARDYGIFVDWAPNEKVALEIATGVSFAGLRSIVTMKGPGINVAADALMSVAYSGVNGGMVILVADDPGPHTTQTEQDSRYYAYISLLPLLEPSTPQEALNMTKWAFELSEKYKIPVILRTTTRLNHTSSNVTIGEIEKLERVPNFHKDPHRYIRAYMTANLERHKFLNQLLNKISEDDFYKSSFNLLEHSGDLLVITSGTAYTYVKDIGSLIPDTFSILKIGTVYPFPKKLVREIIEHKKIKKILVVEELEPILEREVRLLVQMNNLNVSVYGKLDSRLPREGELNHEIVLRAINETFKINLGAFADKFTTDSSSNLPSRPPPLCPGCPHRNSYIALKKAIKEAGYKIRDVPVMGDIGCYALSFEKPLEAIWTEHEMGASISLAIGLKVAGIKTPVIATIGDSTFFHNGIQPLIDAVHNNIPIKVLILDNEITAMTGHQTHPGLKLLPDGRLGKKVNIEDIVKGIGITFLRIVDPYNLEEATQAIKEAILHDGPAVVILRRWCAIVAKRKKMTDLPYYIDPELCINCKACILGTGCPSLISLPNVVTIDEASCVGCGLCVRYCPKDAIRRKNENE